MLDATETHGRIFETGDVVHGRPTVNGKLQPRRKGVVLGQLTKGDVKGVVVWWYTQGSAVDASTLMWQDELSFSGDIWDMSVRNATALYNRAGDYPRAKSLSVLLLNHVWRLRKAGAQHPERY